MIVRTSFVITIMSSDRRHSLYLFLSTVYSIVVVTIYLQSAIMGFAMNFCDLAEFVSFFLIS